MSNGIYVEIPIKASIDKLWKYTQSPEIHQQWDLRFTKIDYIPKKSENDPQHFLYTTQIGFGLKVSGKGESTGTHHKSNTEFTSALKFWSDDPASLIKAGSGYWKYIPNKDSTKFLTWYDYEVRFGKVGMIFDKLVFRPIIGWATAWSFDCLKIWLEKGIDPSVSKRGLLNQIIICTVLSIVWIYQGLIPKILYPDTGEIEILRSSGLFNGAEESVILFIGFLEIIFGVLFLLKFNYNKLHYINVILLLTLSVGALFSKPTIFLAPFNPFTLSLSMISLSVISLINNSTLPNANNCLRKPIA